MKKTEEKRPRSGGDDAAKKTGHRNVNTRPSARQETLPHAIEYAARGWRVHPLNGKIPVLADWPKKATTDEGTITEWWTNGYATANVGIACGRASGLVVIDIDPRNGGDESILKLEQEYGPLPKTITVATPSGGRHVYLAYPSGDVHIGNRANFGGARGIDIRGQGGQVAAPPSVGANGIAYRWIGDSDSAAPIPPAWLAILVEQPRQLANRTNLDPDFSKARKADALIAMLRIKPKAGENDGSKRLFAVACRAIEFDQTDNDAVALIQQYAALHPFPRNYTEAEIRQRLADAAKKTTGGLGIPDGDANDVELVQRDGTTVQPSTATTKKSKAPKWIPFPVHALPEPLRAYVVETEKAMGCDASYAALPLLTAAAAPIGGAYRIQIKRGWTEPAILWTAIVGESGTMKTPPFKAAIRFLREIQSEYLKRYQEEYKAYEAALMQHDVDVKAWSRAAAKGQGGNPPEKPEPPICTRFVVSDVTVEALAPILQSNPVGVLLARDELSGWIRSFDQYKAGKGGDVAHWLSAHNGESITIDRKSGTQKTIYVPSACVSVTGGIQPGILDRVLGEEHRENGLLPRLFLAWPPKRKKVWTEAEVPEHVERAVVSLFDGLTRLDFQDDGRPHILEFSPCGKAAWVAFYGQHAEEQFSMSGDLGAAWSKLEGGTARIALVIHMVRRVAGDRTLANVNAIDRQSVEAAIEISQWFGNEAKRLYAAFDESEADRDRRALIDWIRGCGDGVTARDVTKGVWRLKGKADEAEAELTRLVSMGVGRWKTTTGTGRQTRVFELLERIPIPVSTKNIKENVGNGDGDEPSDVKNAVSEARP